MSEPQAVDLELDPLLTAFHQQKSFPLGASVLSVEWWWVLFFFFLLFFVVLEIEFRTWCILGNDLSLSHGSPALLKSHFKTGSKFPRPAFDLWSSCLSLFSSLNYKQAPPHLTSLFHLCKGLSQSVGAQLVGSAPCSSWVAAVLEAGRFVWIRVEGCRILCLVTGRRCWFLWHIPCLQLGWSQESMISFRFQCPEKGSDCPCQIASKWLSQDENSCLVTSGSVLLLLLTVRPLSGHLLLLNRSLKTTCAPWSLQDPLLKSSV